MRLRLSDGTIIPLTAQPDRGEVPEGVRVFGGGQPDPAVRRDRYAGCCEDAPSVRIPVRFCRRRRFVPPYGAALDTSWAAVEAVVGIDTARARWPLQVALLDTLPMAAELDDDTAHAGTTDSVITGRAVPGGDLRLVLPLRNARRSDRTPER